MKSPYSEGNTELPIIDMGALRDDHESPVALKCIQDLMAACHGPEFCYIVNHGIGPGLEAEVLDSARTFFALPETDRLAIVNTKSAQFRGYTRLGMEHTNNARDWRDQIDFGPEREALALGADDPIWKRLHGPNQWPPALPEMRPFMTEWMERMSELGTVLMSTLAVGLGHEQRYFEYLQPEGPEFLVKVIRYPNVPTAEDSSQGVGLHQDSGLLTFILQSDVSGLQVGIGDQIVPADPIAGTLVMNLGEMLQIATKGYLRATRHRVVMPPPGSERISVAYFLNPALEAQVEPVPLPQDLAAEAAGGENTNQDDPVFSIYGANNLKFRARSHPDVAAIHYPELSAGKLGDPQEGSDTLSDLPTPCSRLSI